MTEKDDPTCKKCGRALTLIGTLPSIGNKPTTSIYKCAPCVLVSAIPPLAYKLKPAGVESGGF